MDVRELLFREAERIRSIFLDHRREYLFERRHLLRAGQFYSRYLPDAKLSVRVYWEPARTMFRMQWYKLTSKGTPRSDKKRKRETYSMNKDLRYRPDIFLHGPPFEAEIGTQCEQQFHRIRVILSELSKIERRLDKINVLIQGRNDIDANTNELPPLFSQPLRMRLIAEPTDASTQSK